MTSGYSTVLIIMCSYAGIMMFVQLNRGLWGEKNPRIKNLPAEHHRSKKIGVAMEVEPTNAHLDNWEWRVHFTGDEEPLSIEYPFGSGTNSHPDCYSVVAWCNDEGTAWERARECADEARARWAAEQVRVGRKSSDHVPL